MIDPTSYDWVGKNTAAKKEAIWVWKLAIGVVSFALFTLIVWSF